MQDRPQFETAFHKRWNACLTIFSVFAKTDSCMNQAVSQLASTAANLTVLSIVFIQKL